MTRIIFVSFLCVSLSTHAQTTIDQIDFYYDETGAIMQEGNVSLLHPREANK